MLAALAASKTGTLAELGTGCGVGAAWLHSGAQGSARIVTAELEANLAEDVQRIFSDVESIEVVSGDWSSLEKYAPFSLLFVDVKDVKESIDTVADLLDAGGIVVLDDYVPSPFWPPIADGRVDTAREQWLTDPRFAAVEMLIDPDASLIIATRR